MLAFAGRSGKLGMGPSAASMCHNVYALVQLFWSSIGFSSRHGMAAWEASRSRRRVFMIKVRCQTITLRPAPKCLLLLVARVPMPAFHHHSPAR